MATTTARDTRTRPSNPDPVPGAPVRRLSTGGAAAHYVGALFGPSLLLLPGLAASEAGPGSVLAWLVLLGLSALIAVVFNRLGTALGSSAGVAGYVTAGLGPRLGALTGWVFFAGVVAGAPVVCLIGGEYVATAAGRPGAGPTAAAGLLVLVLLIRLAGASTGDRLQSVLVGLLMLLLLVAVVGSLGAVRAAHWHPFLPHGSGGVGRAASHLMLAFVGWEAAAPLTVRLADPARQLPRVIGIAFAVTAVTYLALAASTVAVLGSSVRAGTPVSDLMRAALGGSGPWLAAVVAVLLTLGATNTYLQGAVATTGRLLGRRAEGGEGGKGGKHGGGGRGSQLLLLLGVSAFGAVLLALTALHVMGIGTLVATPTTLFLLVYLACTIAASRVLRGFPRVAAGLAAVAITGLLAAAGTVTLLVLAATGAVVGAVAAAHHCGSRCGEGRLRSRRCRSG